MSGDVSDLPKKFIRKKMTQCLGISNNTKTITFLISFWLFLAHTKYFLTFKSNSKFEEILTHSKSMSIMFNILISGSCF